MAGKTPTGARASASEGAFGFEVGVVDTAELPANFVPLEGHAVRGDGQVVAQTEDHTQVVLGNVFLTYTLGPATHVNMERLARNLDRFFGSLGARQGVFLLITKAGATPPDPESRRLLEAVLNRHRDRVSGTGVLIDAPGFYGATLRAAATTLFMLMARSSRVSFFADETAVATWAAEKSGMPMASVLRLIRQAEHRLASVVSPD